MTSHPRTSAMGSGLSLPLGKRPAGAEINSTFEFKNFFAPLVLPLNKQKTPTDLVSERALFITLFYLQLVFHLGIIYLTFHHKHHCRNQMHV